MLAMGPVWCYWAFPMERFCGGLARSPKSPRAPFSSIDRRVLEVAQLSQIRLMYGLGEKLDLDDRGEHLSTGTRYHNYPASVFVRPRIHETLPISLHRLLAKYLSPIVGVSAKAIENRLPTHQFVQWGRMQSVTDKGMGDLVRSEEMVKDEDDTQRDASYVKYFTKVDRCDVWKPTKLDRVTEGYGQVQRFIVIDIDFLQKITDDTPILIIDPIIVSVIRPIPLFSLLRDSNVITYKLPSNKLAAPEIVGVDDIVCLVGRVEAPDGAWYITDRNSIIGRVDLVDELLDPD
ncbi:hypothetical protein FS749_008795 [Ceratobasidium sp. UAMH 11750]|nr:hypothetical protein FS749_008795 [Ceratobasidium sp. UAMH 11750]